MSEGIKLPLASATVQGLVGTSTQTFAGAKTISASSFDFTTGAAATTFTHNYTNSALHAQIGLNGSSGKIISTGTTNYFNMAFTDGIEWGDTSNNIRGRMTAAGTWSNTSGTWSTLSDERIKDNITPLANSLDKIASLRPVSYTWKMDEVSPLKPTIGFIAQEVELILPGIVNAYPESYTYNGQQLEVNDAKHLNLGSELFAHLVGAIQELKRQLDTATARITALGG